VERVQQAVTKMIKDLEWKNPKGRLWEMNFFSLRRRSLRTYTMAPATTQNAVVKMTTLNSSL